MAKTNQKVETVTPDVAGEIKLATDGALGVAELVNDIINPSLSFEFTDSKGKKIVMSQADTGNFLSEQGKINAENQKVQNEIKILDTDKMKEIVLSTCLQVQSKIENSSLKNADGNIKSKILEDTFDNLLFSKGRLSANPDDANHITSIYQQQNNAKKYIEFIPYEKDMSLAQWKREYEMHIADVGGKKMLTASKHETRRKSLNGKLDLKISLNKDELKALDVVVSGLARCDAELTEISDKRKAEKAKKK